MTNGRGTFPVASVERSLGAKETQLYGYLLPCKVAAANYKAGKVKVVIHEGTSDAFQTEWLPFLTNRAGNTREWNPPEVGEKGVLLSPTGRPKVGYFLPASFYEDAPLPSTEVDIHKIIYLKEEIGLYEYNRRSGRRRWRIHGGGEYRHEIGLFEKDGDKGTSDVIQTKDFIQLRVGETRMVIRDGLIRFFMVNDKNEVVELKMDFSGIEATVKDTGIFRVTDKEAALGVQEAGVVTGSQSTPAAISGLVATDGGAQIVHKRSSVVKVADDINLEMMDVLSGQSAGSRVSITSAGTRIQAGTSAVTVAQAAVDSRVQGSSFTLTPAATVLVTPQFATQIPGNAPGNVFQGGSAFKFNAANKLAPPETPKPPPISKENKPFLPDD